MTQPSSTQSASSQSSLVRPRIGISACMLGQNVRFDGGHKRHPWVNDKLGDVVEFVPICPEVEAGLRTPRESMRLVGSSLGSPVLIGNKTGEDYTERLATWSDARVEDIATMKLDGYVLMKNSPSCGLERVKIYPAPVNGEPVHASPARNGIGVFAERLKKRLPALPLTEGGWLCDPGLRETFLEQIFAHCRMRTALLEAPTMGKLVAFHTEHKLQLMARSPAQYRELGRMVAHASKRPLEEVLTEYTKLVTHTLSERTTPGKQANVLQHVVGYFKDALSPDEKEEIIESIDDFRNGFHGIAVPLTLIAHHMRRQPAIPNETGGVTWLNRQHYFQPFPKGLHRTPLNIARY